MRLSVVMLGLGLGVAGCHAPPAEPGPASPRPASPRRTAELRRFVRDFHVVYGEALRRAAAPKAALGQALKHPRAGVHELPLLRRVYGRRSARLRFVAGRSLGEAGARIAERLENMKQEGLDPGRFGAARIRRAREALKRQERPEPPDPPRGSELDILRAAASGAEPGLPGPELHRHLLQAAIAPRRGVPRLARAFARDVARQRELARRAAELELALADGFLSYARVIGGGLAKVGELLLSRDRKPETKAGSASAPTSRPTRKKTPGPAAHVERELERALLAIEDRETAEKALQRLAPHPQYRRLQAALARYRKIVASGGWKKVTQRRGLRPGRRGRAVAALGERLAAEGYLEAAAARSDDLYDAALAEAVRAYQRTHQLEVTGRPHRLFWRSLDVPASRRLAAIEITLARWRESAAGRLPYHVLVNIPGFHVEVWRGGRRLLRDRIIVGRARETECDEETRREVPAFATPRQSAWLRSLVFSPYWNVTRDIKESELDLERGKDPHFYEKHGYEVMRAGKPGEWVREMPGPKNSLGFVKFLFPNPHETYLHGTPHKNLFRRHVRAYSHGCMRVEHPRPLARLLLQNDGQWHEGRYDRLYRRWQSMDFKPLLKEWDPELYDRLRERAEELETRVELRRPVPIHVEYFTVRVDDGGDVHFLADIYRLDEQRLSPRPAKSCIPESELAKRNARVMTRRVETLEKQALFLGPCSLAAAAILRTLDPEGPREVRRRRRRLEQLQRFTRAHANLARVVREAHKELLEALSNRRGRWRDSLVRKAVRVHRLLKGLEKLTRTTQAGCKRLVGR